MKTSEPSAIVRNSREVHDRWIEHVGNHMACVGKTRGPNDIIAMVIVFEGGGASILGILSSARLIAARDAVETAIVALERGVIVDQGSGANVEQRETTIAQPIAPTPTAYPH